jgi:hypothetical protein
VLNKFTREFRFRRAAALAARLAKFYFFSITVTFKNWLNLPLPSSVQFPELVRKEKKKKFEFRVSNHCSEFDFSSEPVVPLSAVAGAAICSGHSALVQPLVS